MANNNFISVDAEAFTSFLKEHGINMQDASKKIKRSRSFISQRLTGPQTIEERDLIFLAEALGIDPPEKILDEIKPKPTPKPMPKTNPANSSANNETVFMMQLYSLAGKLNELSNQAGELRVNIENCTSAIGGLNEWCTDAGAVLSNIDRKLSALINYRNSLPEADRIKEAMEMLNGLYDTSVIETVQWLKSRFTGAGTDTSGGKAVSEDGIFQAATAAGISPQVLRVAREYLGIQIRNINDEPKWVLYKKDKFI